MCPVMLPGSPLLLCMHIGRAIHLPASRQAGLVSQRCCQGGRQLAQGDQYEVIHLIITLCNIYNISCGGTHQHAHVLQLAEQAALRPLANAAAGCQDQARGAVLREVHGQRLPEAAQAAGEDVHAAGPAAQQREEVPAGNRAV